MLSERQPEVVADPPDDLRLRHVVVVNQATTTENGRLRVLSHVVIWPAIVELRVRERGKPGGRRGAMWEVWHLADDVGTEYRGLGGGGHGDGVRTGGVVLHVADVDAHFERVRAAGGNILREPTDEDYGQREYGIRDPEGHDWYIATPFT